MNDSRQDAKEWKFSVFLQSFSLLRSLWENNNMKRVALRTLLWNWININLSCHWLRTIPQAGYIKLGSIRYGAARISNLNLQDYPLAPTSSPQQWKRSNKPALLSVEDKSSSIMSPSAAQKNAENKAKAICSDECCCCISSSSTSSQTRLPILQSGEHRLCVRKWRMRWEKWMRTSSRFDSTS